MVNLKIKYFSALIILAIILPGSLPPNALTQNVNDQVRSDWPQIGHDAQHTNFSPVEVDPPYCYAWKWYEAPIANRAQPVVAGGRLFIGSMNGKLYARDASTGAPLWEFASQGPIRNSAGVSGSQVIFSSHDGYTYALDVAAGSLAWKTYTGASMTAPLIDDTGGRVYVGSSDGILSALDVSSGQVAWQYHARAPILITPALSPDGTVLYFGSEVVEAIAVRAADGRQLWRTPLQGQSLADRYPVVVGSQVIYRSQPVYFFHQLLHEGDDAMDAAGPVNADWSADWSAVKPQILKYLQNAPSKQTFFVLDAVTGQPSGLAPVLYTYGNNDTPNTPVIKENQAYVTYRARHGIQTDGGSVHVSSKYDAEPGLLNLNSLDIQGLRQSNYPAFNVEFRMTSDEDTNLSMGGNILYMDSWERLGGFNTQSNALIFVSNVSNDWPECYTICGTTANVSFFPMLAGQPAYPFPEPRLTEGRQRPGLVIANNMLYWRVIEAGLAAFSHQEGSSCPGPRVWSGNSQPDTTASLAPSNPADLTAYITQDLTTPPAHPAADLVDRINREVRQLLDTAQGQHLLPYYVQRGFSKPFLWPADVPSDQKGPGAVTFAGEGNIYWFDPGELLYTMALAYPYLEPGLQNRLKAYMQAEMPRYPPLQNLPWNDPNHDWLHQGSPRERYQVPFRSDLTGWPPPAVPLQSLYAVWLWSKNTGDWSYAKDHWSDAKDLFNNRKSLPLQYYADLAGYIGFARLAAHFNDQAAYNDAVQAASQAMQSGENFAAMQDFATRTYLDPRDQATGWSEPVFFGLTPEVGLYLRQQTGGQAASYLLSKESGDGARWWYLTRVGTHAEAGETSFLAPSTSWSHFLAHAYIEGDSQEALRGWLDRPWTPGDLYSIQKAAAALQAVPAGPDLSASRIQINPQAGGLCQSAGVTITLLEQGAPLSGSLSLTSRLPDGVVYMQGSLSSSAGQIDASAAPVIKWAGSLNPGQPVTIQFTIQSTALYPTWLKISAQIDAGTGAPLTLQVPYFASALNGLPWQIGDNCPNP